MSPVIVAVTASRMDPPASVMRRVEPSRGPPARSLTTQVPPGQGPFPTMTSGEGVLIVQPSGAHDVQAPAVRSSAGTDCARLAVGVALAMKAATTKPNTQDLRSIIGPPSTRSDSRTSGESTRWAE